MSEQEEISSGATKDKLQGLWLSVLNSFVVAMGADKPPTSEMMNCIRLFLKDNGVQKDVSLPKGLEALSDLALPFQ